ncbi:MAG: metallophosphoesterase [Nanoarchaeota archaeon]
MTNVFFTADTHFGHENIIKYCKRPFKNVQEMDNKIIFNWNKKVKPGDKVYFAGDFCFKHSKKDSKSFRYWLSQLNGEVIFFKGNHDSKNSLNTKLVSGIIKIDGEEVFICHCPKDYSKAQKINLVGHVHEKWKIKKIGENILVNIGVDQWNFTPIRWEEISTEIKKFYSNFIQNNQ